MKRLMLISLFLLSGCFNEDRAEALNLLKSSCTEKGGVLEITAYVNSILESVSVTCTIKPK